MSFKDHPHSRGPQSDGASRPARPAGARDQRRSGPSLGNRDDRGPRRAGGSDRPRFNDERAPRREGGFGGGDRPRFNDRNERGPRPEGGDRPRFNRDDRGPRPERSFGDRPRREEGGFGRSDRPRFNDERAPRREGGFGGGDRPRFNDRNERGPRPEGDRPRFNRDERGPRREAAGDRPRVHKERRFGDDRARNQPVREERPDYANNEGEIRRAFSGIRTYRAPAALKGKAAPVKVIRPEDKRDEKQ